MVDNKNTTANKAETSDILENPWDNIAKQGNAAQLAEESERDDFQSAFREFKKTLTFKVLVVVLSLAIIGGVGWGIYALSTADFAIDEMSGSEFFDYLEENSDVFWTYLHISIFGLVMLIFAARDHISFKKGQHLESKSLIVSLGVSGTFLGIFLGLQGFDPNDINGSVPELLNGLKFAFATSILGMFFTIPLAAMQQMPNVDSKSEMRTLIAMDDKLSSVECLPSMAKNMHKSMEAISNMQKNIKDELIDENSARTNEILGQIAARTAKTVELLGVLEMSINNLTQANKTLVEAIGKNGGARAPKRVTGSVPSVYE